MRRRRSHSALLSWARCSANALALLAAIACSVAGQDVAREGALFLLVPVGARAVGQGQAVVASRMGADGIWWNPASMAWAKNRQLTADHSQNFFVKGADAVDESVARSA